VRCLPRSMRRPLPGKPSWTCPPGLGASGEQRRSAAGQAAIHWRLLTTHGVISAAQAWAVAGLYRRRWAIEQMFRTLKTGGFDIEGVRIAEPAPRNRLVTAALIAAVRIQQLVHARDGGPGPLRPVSDAFEPQELALLEACCAQLEGKTQRQKNPHPKDSLAYAAWVCARLGGWTGYYGKPGPIGLAARVARIPSQKTRP